MFLLLIVSASLPDEDAMHSVGSWKDAQEQARSLEIQRIMKEQITQPITPRITFLKASKGSLSSPKSTEKADETEEAGELFDFEP